MNAINGHPEPGTRIYVESRKLRAVTFLPSGHRFEGWLPRGSYEIGEPTRISAGRGSAEMIDATTLHPCGHSRGQWYVGQRVLDGFPENVL